MVSLLLEAGLIAPLLLFYTFTLLLSFLLYFFFIILFAHSRVRVLRKACITKWPFVLDTLLRGQTERRAKGGRGARDSR